MYDLVYRQDLLHMSFVTDIKGNHSKTPKINYLIHPLSDFSHLPTKYMVKPVARNVPSKTIHRSSENGERKAKSKLGLLPIGWTCNSVSPVEKYILIGFFLFLVQRPFFASTKCKQYIVYRYNISQMHQNSRLEKKYQH